MVDEIVLPKDWKLEKLGNLAKFIDYSGRTPRKTNSGILLNTAKNVKMGYVNEEPREYIDASDYDSWMTRGIPQKGDVLFTTEAPLGNVAQINSDAKIALAQRIITFQTCEAVNNTFLKYELLGPQFQKQLNAKGTGTTVKGIKAAILKQFEILVPPLREQHHIVAKIEELFSDLDKGIESLQTAQLQLKTYRQAVLKYAFEGWFTNPVVKDGELPAGWKKQTLGKIVDTVFDGPFGSNLKSDDYVDRGVRVIRLENIGALKFKDEKKTYVSEEKYESIKRHTVKGGDIVFSSFIAEEVRVTILPEAIKKAINKADCFCIRTSPEKLLTKYLVYYLSTKALYNQLENEIHGATRPRINTKQLKIIEIPVCNIFEQQHIVEEIEDRLSVCDKVEETIEASLLQSESLRQSILKKAFEGKLV